jgi:hypothetical protein
LTVAYPWAGERKRQVPGCTLAQLVGAHDAVQFRHLLTSWTVDRLDAVGHIGRASAGAMTPASQGQPGFPHD